MSEEKIELYSRLNILSQKTAAGIATEEEMNELDAIQEKLGIKNSYGAINTQKARQLNRFESNLKEVEKTLKNILKKGEK